jgi:D-beta-D-heptose 7-phosphate kinase/D-beta-D-heptose 1-phosphate adenosyltransferase
MQQRKQLKVLLIGDSCTDEYVYGTCERLNPEAPVPILKLNRKETTKGMTWNVKENLISFGIEVCIITHEETIVKTRYIDENYNQQILRVDYEPDIKPINYELPEDEYDALVISDYNKGFLTVEKISEIVNSFPGPVFIDTKKNYLPELDAYVKINEHEYDNFKSSIKKLIVTKGGKGCEYNGKLYPAEKVNVFDVVGAGDTFLSALVYFYLKYDTIEKAIPHANKAAAIAVSNFGTYALTKNDVETIL